MSDTVVVAIEQAAEAVRAANHDGARPEYPSTQYDRVGAVVDLLHKLEQLTTRVQRDVAFMPVTHGSMTHDEGGDPAAAVSAAATALANVMDQLPYLINEAQLAHSNLSHLGLNWNGSDREA